MSKHVCTAILCWCSSDMDFQSLGNVLPLSLFGFSFSVFGSAGVLAVC